ncbi:hypothetical protein Tco_0766114 [Tanacetum coccineum]
MKAICKLDVHVVSKAPKPSSQSEEVPQGKKPRAKSRLRRKQSSKHTSDHPLPPTPVVGEMHNEAQQAASGPTSLEATSEEGAHPQLSSGHDASADSIAEVDPGLSAPRSNPSVLVDKTKSVGDGLKTTHTNLGTNEESRADDISKKINHEDLSEFLKDTRSAFFTPNSPQDDHIIVTNESEEAEANKEDTYDTSHGVPEDTLVLPPPSPKSTQIQDLMAQPALSKLLASHNFASCLPTELKELPLKFTELSGEIKELKQHVKDMEIELPGDLKEIPTKLETFTSTISSLSSYVAELKTIQWELPSEFLDLPSHVCHCGGTASGAITADVPSAGQATALPTEWEKNTKDAKTNLKGPITLKIYKEDGSEEVISNLKFESLKFLQRQLFRSLEDWEVSLLQCMQRSSEQKPELMLTNEFEAKYNKVKAKLALPSSSDSTSKSLMIKKKGLAAKAYEWDKENVSSDDNEMVEVKVLMSLNDDENVFIGKESARNGEWVKILMKKIKETILC